MPYKLVAFGLSDVGLVRENNEDAWGAVPELGFFVLADGMGGHQAGEVAAREAVASLCRLIKKTFGRKKNISYADAVKVLQHSIEEVNAIVYEHSRKDPELRGMGTTICCLQFHQQGLIYAHVGDSRIYRLHENKLEQITTDHSLMRELIDLGQLSEGEAPEFLYKNILTKALGTEPRVDPTINVCNINNNDAFLICSDGLSDLVTPEEMEKIMVHNQKKPVEVCVKKLVDAAKAKGGFDNISIVLVRIEETSAIADESKNISR